MINLVIFYSIRSLICTIIIELLIGLLLGIRNKKDILLIILVNIFTNLLVTSISFTINYYFGINFKNIVLLLLEVFAFISEAIIYKNYFNFNKINPYVVSLILNVSSFTLGLLINYSF